MSKKLHPCQKCGACCASFRVSFYWIQAEDYIEDSVPQSFIEDLDLSTRCMKGTNNKHQPKCTALTGRVGQMAHCSIYNNRPLPCRNFKASFETGYQEPRCDEARLKHGLKALTKWDWKEIQK